MVPSGVKIAKDVTLTPSQLADAVVLAGKILSASPEGGGAPPPLKHGAQYGNVRTDRHGQVVEHAVEIRKPLRQIATGNRSLDKKTYRYLHAMVQATLHLR